MFPGRRQGTQGRLRQLNMTMLETTPEEVHKVNKCASQEQGKRTAPRAKGGAKAGSEKCADYNE